MGYMLQPLLSIRIMRQDRASGELTAARQAVRTAEETVDKRKDELEEFEKTKEERRDKIYDAVIGRPVRRESLDLVREGVLKIDEEGAMRLDGVRRAEVELQKRISEAETARNVYIAASKNRMKIDEHKAVWREEEAREAEFRAESELEDFTGRKQDLDD